MSVYRGPNWVTRCLRRKGVWKLCKKVYQGWDICQAPWYNYLYRLIDYPVCQIRAHILAHIPALEAGKVVELLERGLVPVLELRHPGVV